MIATRGESYQEHISRGLKWAMLYFYMKGVWAWFWGLVETEQQTKRLRATVILGSLSEQDLNILNKI